VVLRVTGTAGVRTRSPFQLSLGGDLGVRGYPRERFPGGRRILISLEDRILFEGPFRNIMDLGATAFLDLGRIWPGDAPFGIDSGWRAAAGVGLRNALPSGGRRTYRIDLALPIRPDVGWKDLRLILSVGELIGLSPSSRRERVEEMQRFTTRNPFYFPD
jgi:outer membrane translocation and assembly module TamA